MGLSDQLILAYRVQTEGEQKLVELSKLDQSAVKSFIAGQREMADAAGRTAGSHKLLGMEVEGGERRMARFTTSALMLSGTMGDLGPKMEQVHSGLFLVFSAMTSGLGTMGLVLVGLGALAAAAAALAAEDRHLDEAIEKSGDALAAMAEKGRLLTESERMVVDATLRLKAASLADAEQHLAAAEAGNVHHTALDSLRILLNQFRGADGIYDDTALYIRRVTEETGKWSIATDEARIAAEKLATVEGRFVPRDKALLVAPTIGPKATTDQQNELYYEDEMRQAADKATAIFDKQNESLARLKAQIDKTFSPLGADFLLSVQKIDQAIPSLETDIARHEMHLPEGEKPGPIQYLKHPAISLDKADQPAPDYYEDQRARLNSADDETYEKRWLALMHAGRNEEQARSIAAVERHRKELADKKTADDAYWAAKLPMERLGHDLTVTMQHSVTAGGVAMYRTLTHEAENYFLFHKTASGLLTHIVKSGEREAAAAALEGLATIEKAEARHLAQEAAAYAFINPLKAAGYAAGALVLEGAAAIQEGGAAAIRSREVQQEQRNDQMIAGTYGAPSSGSGGGSAGGGSQGSWGLSGSGGGSPSYSQPYQSSAPSAPAPAPVTNIVVNLTGLSFAGSPDDFVRFFKTALNEAGKKGQLPAFVTRH